MDDEVARARTPAWFDVGPKSLWCGACRDDGPAHPCCSVHHMRSHLYDSSMPVGPGMPIESIAVLTDRAPVVMVAQGTAPTASGGRRWLTGTGVGASLEDAAARAVSELVERMVLHTAPRQIVAGEQGDLPGAIGGVSTGIGWWVAGHRLDGGDAWVPLDWVQLVGSRRSTVRGRAPDSTGAAAHPEPDAAVLGGCLEVVERRYAASLVTGLTTGVDELAFRSAATERLDENGSRWSVIVGHFGAWSVAVSMLDDDVRVVGGAACDASPVLAVAKAVDEAYGKLTAATSRGVVSSSLAGSAAVRVRRRFNRLVGDPGRAVVLEANTFPDEEGESPMIVVSRTDPDRPALGRAVAQVVTATDTFKRQQSQEVTSRDIRALLA